MIVHGGTVTEIPHGRKRYWNNRSGLTATMTTIRKSEHEAVCTVIVRSKRKVVFKATLTTSQATGLKQTVETYAPKLYVPGSLKGLCGQKKLPA